MDEDEKQQLEWLRGDAHIAHEAHRKSMADHISLVGGFSNAAMRAPALAAAGAIAALLGFFSANYRAISGTAGQLHFNEALVLFSASALLSVLAPAFAYFTQFTFLWALGSERFAWQRPFVSETPRSRWLNRIGVGLQIVTILIVFCAIALLVVGGISFLKLAYFVGGNGLSPLWTPSPA